MNYCPLNSSKVKMCAKKHKTAFKNIKQINFNCKLYQCHNYFQNGRLFFCSSTMVRDYIDTMKTTFDFNFNLYQAVKHSLMHNIVNYKTRWVKHTKRQEVGSKHLF